MRRLHAAAGIAGGLMLIKIVAINMGENIIQQWLGAEYGLTLETILLGFAFGLIIWFVVKNG